MIAVQLDKSDAKFMPGDTISGTVRWSNDKDLPESIDIRLIWFTRGKGNRDVDVMSNSAFQPSEQSGEHAFQFQAPSYPYSFSGKLISLVWAVEAISFPEQEADQAEMIIAPGGVEVLLDSDATSG